MSHLKNCPVVSILHMHGSSGSTSLYPISMLTNTAELYDCERENQKSIAHGEFKSSFTNLVFVLKWIRRDIIHDLQEQEHCVITKGGIAHCCIRIWHKLIIKTAMLQNWLLTLQLRIYLHYTKWQPLMAMLYPRGQWSKHKPIPPCVSIVMEQTL